MLRSVLSENVKDEALVSPLAAAWFRRGAKRRVQQHGGRRHVSPFLRQRVCHLVLRRLTRQSLFELSEHFRQWLRHRRLLRLWQNRLNL